MKTLRQQDVIKIDSGVEGPKVCILGGIHGNERCGVEAIEKIVSKDLLLLKKGSVTFIYANRRAIDQNVRFTEKNLNRCFKKEIVGDSYEENLAGDIKEILKDCDISLDLHASNTKNSEPFIICENNSFDLIKFIPIKKVCSGFDDLHEGGSDSYMNSIGKIGICVECGYLGDIKSKEVAIQTVFSFLGNLKMIDFNYKDFEKEYFKVKQMYKCKNGFVPVKKFKDFEIIKKYEAIGYDGGEQIKAKEDGFVLFVREKKMHDKSNEAFMFGVRGF